MSGAFPNTLTRRGGLHFAAAACFALLALPAAAQNTKVPPTELMSREALPDIVPVSYTHLTLPTKRIV